MAPRFLSMAKVTEWGGGETDLLRRVSNDALANAAFFSAELEKLEKYSRDGGQRRKIPFVQNHSGNHSKIMFICIYICYDLQIISEIILSATLPPL